jgi:hypothetical protein
MRIFSDVTKEVWVEDKRNLWQACLPPSLQQILLEGLGHVAVEREKIARTLHADARSLPPVQVMLALLQRGPATTVFATAPVPLRTAGGAKAYGVLASAACLLAGTDLVRKILEHELSHIFHSLRHFTEMEKPEWKAKSDHERLALSWLSPNRVDEFLFSNDDSLKPALEHARRLLVPRLPIVDLAAYQVPVAKPVQKVGKKKSVAARGKY